MRLTTLNKNIIISTLIIAIYTFYSNVVFGQLFNDDQNPPSVKFKQIHTPQFQIIYPTLFENEAQRMANVLEYIIKDVAKSLGRSPRPISIILQTQGVVSNGFVQMAPRKSEFYTIPGQEFDAQDWLNSLAVHELRHVVQFDKLAPNLSAPLFEELKLALFGITLPPWFFEGDAVITETLLTEAGRGRQPKFDLVLRANEMSGKHYSYSKNYFGSLKSYTPGYYTLGYFMTTKIRRDGDVGILDKTMERIRKFPLRPYNFTSSLKKLSGTGTAKLYRETMAEIDSIWTDKTKAAKFQSYKPIHKIDDKIPTSYLLPYSTLDSTIICLKGSKAQTPAIVSIKNGNEKMLLRIGYQTEPNLHYAAGKIVWDEYRSDPRFGQRSYNVICTYHLRTKQYQQLTIKSRLFSPSLSADGNRIIAVQVNTENTFNLVELDANTGKTHKTYPNPNNYTLQTPSYNQEGSKVVVTAVNNEGVRLLVYDLIKNTIEQITEPQRQMISRPILFQGQIIYKAHYNGIDNIYAVELATKAIHQITLTRFGAYNASITRDGLIYFNEYLPTGYIITSTDLKAPESRIEKVDNTFFINYTEPLKSQENSLNVFDGIPEKNYVGSNYKGLRTLFYIHSLQPIVENSIVNNQLNFGFNLLSNNLLNTLSTYAGYTYNNALEKNEFRVGFSYLKYYPQISVNFENRAQLSYYQQQSGGNTTSIPFQWKENYTSLKVSIPYFTNWLNKDFFANFSLETSYTKRYNFSFLPDNVAQELTLPLRYQLSMGSNVDRSPRDLAPRWGQNIQVSYRHLPFIRQLSGDLLTLETQFYTPGLAINHSFQTSINFQASTGNYQGLIDIPRASGYANLSPLSALYNSILFDYRFPILYPDWELGPLAYIKRIKGGFFADFENMGRSGGLRSYGAELRADMNLLRFYLPNFDVSSKIIFPYKSQVKTPIFEFGLFYNL